MPQLTAQALADRAEISDVVFAYARALDRRDWALMSSILTDPVRIDYSSWSPDLAARDMAASEWIDRIKALAGFDATQHISANHHITIDGERATCVSYMQASHFLTEGGGGEPADSTLFGFYTNDLVRTDEGWKLCGVTLDVTARQGDAGVFARAFGRIAGVGGATAGSRPAFTLYGVAISPFVQRVLMQLRAKGMTPPLEPPPGGLHSDAYRALSPIDKVPLLEVGHVRIPESAVIADWIEDVHPEPPLRPQNPLARAHMAVVARVADLYVMNRMLPLFANLDPARRDTAVVEKALAEVEAGLDWLAHHLGAHGYASGSGLTLADCACTPILWYAQTFLPRFGAADPIGRRPKLQAYWTTMQGCAPAAETTADLAQALAGLG